MTLQTLRLGVAAATLCCAAASAQADITAQDVWSDWRTYLTGMGYTVAGAESRAGNTLSIDDLVLQAELPDSSGSFTATVGNLSFVENGDGSVSVTMPEVIPMVFSGSDSDGSVFTAQIDQTLSGARITVLGTPDDMTTDYRFERLGVALVSLISDGKVIGRDTARGSLTLDGMTGSTRMTAGPVRGYAQTLAAQSLGYDLKVDDSETGDIVTLTGSASGFGFDGTASLPERIDMEDFDVALAAGFAFDGTMSTQGSVTDFLVEGSDEAFTLNTSTQSATIRVAMGPGGLLYLIDQTGLNLTAITQELPFPVVATIARLGFNMAFPLVQSDGPQDFALGLTAADFTISDAIWNIFDPSTILPRDPATLLVELTGKATLLASLLDPAIAEDDDVPAELNALNLNDLRIAFAGAELTGSGAFTFDNSDLTSFDGIPAPTGAIDMLLRGGNGLLDRLVEMGFVPDDQAMGTRMMMGLFAKPIGDDLLSSRIEITGEGHIIANGQRIQ